MKQIANYKLIKLIGGGGSGSVYRAEELMPEGVVREVALKILPVIPESNKKQRDEFVQEARSLMKVANHRYIVTMLNFGIDHGTPWIAMEYLPTTLQDKLSDDPMPVQEITKLITQIAEGLTQIHDQIPVVVHNDIKPANILIDRSGDLKISDFGLAAESDSGNTLTVASVDYAAPEVLDATQGKPGPYTDLYSLGHIAYRAALGTHAYRQQFPAIFHDLEHPNQNAIPTRWIRWHCSIDQQAPPIRQTLAKFPEAMDQLISKLMAKRIEDRYPDAHALLTDLQNCGNALRIPQTPTPTGTPNEYQVGVITDDAETSRLQKLWNHNPILMTIAIVVLILTVSASAFMLTIPKEPVLSMEDAWSASADGKILIEGQIKDHSDQTQLFLEIDGKQLPCAITPDDRFSVGYQLAKPGQYKAAISVVHQGQALGRIPLKLVRDRPQTVAVTVRTRPPVPDTTITVRQSDGSTLSATTDAQGKATIKVMLGSYHIKAQHPRYRAVPTPANTGDQPTTTLALALEDKFTKVTLNITPSSATVVFVPIQSGEDPSAKQEFTLQEQGPTEVELPIGQYRYLIHAQGFNSKQGRINAQAARDNNLSYILAQSKPDKPNYIKLDDLPSLDEIESAALLSLNHDEFAEYLRRNVPLRQITFVVPLGSQPKVRAQGVVISETEKTNLLNRMRNALIRLDTQEVRADPAALARLIQIHLREEVGVKRAKVREWKKNGQDAYSLRIEYNRQDQVTKAKIRAIVRQYVLDSTLIAVIEY